jgi:hypothetical protein
LKMLHQSLMPHSQFVDDDGKCYLEMSYYFEIRKEWPAGTQWCGPGLTRRSMLELIAKPCRKCAIAKEWFIHYFFIINRILIYFLSCHCTLFVAYNYLFAYIIPVRRYSDIYVVLLNFSTQNTHDLFNLYSSILRHFCIL